MIVARIENPLAFGLEPVVKLLHRWNPDPARWLELVEQVSSGRVIAWAGGPSRTQVEALLLLALPAVGLTDRPQIIGFPHRSRRGRNALIQAMLSFLRTAGYTRFIATNETGRDDEVWLRAYATGGPVRRVASVFEFEVENGRSATVSLRRLDPGVPGVPDPDRYDARGVPGPPGRLRQHIVTDIQQRWRPGVQRPAQRRNGPGRAAGPAADASSRA